MTTDESVLGTLARGEECAWFNPQRQPAAKALRQSGVDPKLVDQAAARLQRFAPWIAATFAETAERDGIVESDLVELPTMQQHLGVELPGTLLGKLDSHLPISGSVKARGGVHEVLEYAEQVAQQAGLVGRDDDYHRFQDDDVRELLSRHKIAVGSTGNLALSIGITGAALGLQTTVHMSAEAAQWKKDLLRSKGVEVIEHDTDYTAAVAAGRSAAAADPDCHFVDDEHSLSLFAGYAVAGRRLAAQLAAREIPVDAGHPLFVYLPCGIGGAPGGVAYGLAQQFGDGVHSVFVEPTQAPCMFLGVASGKHDQISVADIGLSGRTVADGLAVGRASGFVGRAVGPLIDGFATVSDEHLLRLRNELEATEGINVEPSAAAGFVGPAAVVADHAYRERIGATDARLAHATHLVWLTGGAMVPAAEFERWRQL